MSDQERRSQLETRSRVSASHKSSGASTRTSVSAAATRARAKAEAAKVKVSFAEKEAVMMKQRASIEASLHVLKQEKEATAALTEAAIFEAAAAEYEEKDADGELQDLTLEDPIKRTRDYVETQQFDVRASQVPQDTTPLSPTLHHETAETQPCIKQESLYESLKEEPDHKPTGERYEPPPAPKEFFLKHKHSPVSPEKERKYKPAAPPVSHPDRYSPSTPQTPDLAQYLMRREMVSSGLLAFDDCPENYWAWKASFLAATRDLNLSEQEELNLLVKWLGPELSAQAKRIRSVHVNNPQAGVLMVWERLEEIYGSPEVIEN